MALDFAKKKRTNLQSIVDRLSEKTQERNPTITPKKQEDLVQPAHRQGMSIKSFLLPPTPSSGRASPSISEGSVSEEEQLNDKPSNPDESTEDVKKDQVIPKQPQRCEVCGLRVYKSYRYTNRTNAPLHLKNFVAQNERVRVCKRCFSSRERCRENLALVLFRSKMSEMVHVRTPLGVTYNRTTKGMDYIARDLKASLKRPYEDLLCDETMADEDEMEVDNERFMLDEPDAKGQDLIPKHSSEENDSISKDSPNPIQKNNVGIVTVVKQQNGKFSLTPNCFTVYGELGSLKITDIPKMDKATDQSGNAHGINATEQLQKLVDHSPHLKKQVSSSANSEINNISTKLTFLDHAYALPPLKGKSPVAIKSQPVNKVKPVVAPKVVKTASVTKQETQKKEVSSSSSSSSDGPTGSVRNCGIVCFLCNNLVTKSYSCYKKESAPEKIKHLFTPVVKVVKVCRRCMPYKKPKEEEAAKSKSKVSNRKIAKMKTAKLIKNAKSTAKGTDTAKGNDIKASEKKSSEKTVVKTPVKDEKKQKKIIMDDNNSKLAPTKKQATLFAQTKKVSPVLQSKQTKIVNDKPSQVSIWKNVVTPKGLSKSDAGSGTSPKTVNTNAKLSSISSKANSGKKESQINAVDKFKNSKIQKEKQESAKVDSGTQSMKSMISVNKLSIKLGDSVMASNGLLKENKATSNLSVKENVANKAVPKEGEEKNVSLTQENITDVMDLTTTTSSDECTIGDDVQTQKANNEDTMQGQNVNSSSPVKENIDSKTKDCEITLKNKSEEGKQEFENKETAGDEGEIMEESRRDKDCYVRETRSASQSPMRTREMKPTDVSSPRRRSSRTPDKKQEDYKQIIPSVMTRKRLASFSESEGDTNHGVTASKRRVVVALLEKVSRKAAVPSSTQNVSGKKEAEESNKKGITADDESKGHPMTRRNQIPIKCPGCNEKVVKSYRCLQRGTAPQHIKPLFEQQSAEMLRVCRKCVNKKWN